MKKVFLYTFILLLALAVLGFAGYSWLKYEFARAQQPDNTELWNRVPVNTLEGLDTSTTPCKQQYPDKRAWYGDLHVHTAASYDATAFDVTTTADQAYAFASGTPMPMRLAGDTPDAEVPVLRISTPLDFMAVTDHAEKLGENAICYDPEANGYNTTACKLFRGDLKLPVDEHLQSLVRLTTFAIFGNSRSIRVCGENGERCRAASVEIWRNNQVSAEQWQDKSGDCRFTTFHAYEYTLAEDASNLHRNVVFKSSTVPQIPLSAKDAGEPEKMLAWLDKTCISGNEECDAIAIPHNSNWSSGRMWFPYSNRDLPLAEQQALADLRARTEPLAEILQVKGDSECRNNIASVFGPNDDLCDFEKLRPASEDIEDCDESFGGGGMMLQGCTSRYNFVRYALTAGLSEEKKLGVNPFKLGIIASSDAHTGAPIANSEADYKGSHGNDRDTRNRLLGKVEVPGDIATGSPVRFNPGGVAGVYAHENSRPALFDAMRQRETFGTSGPRIAPRFFAGWQLDGDACDNPGYVGDAYLKGVPMGSDLPPAPAGNPDSPVFLASATRDPLPGSKQLQRLQVVKGWVDGNGRTHQAVYDIAGAEPGEASVDRNTCATSGRGFSQLCTTWQDPDFDPDTAAVYYLRVLENPSCRWSHHTCQSLPPQERPESCSDPELPWQIQERAWTSPIWYQPAR